MAIKDRTKKLCSPRSSHSSWGENILLSEGERLLLSPLTLLSSHSFNSLHCLQSLLFSYSIKMAVTWHYWTTYKLTATYCCPAIFDIHDIRLTKSMFRYLYIWNFTHTLLWYRTLLKRMHNHNINNPSRCVQDESKHIHNKMLLLREKVIF